MKNYAQIYLKRSYFFWKRVVIHFYNIDASTRASSLAFTSILSLVPLAVVAIGVFSAFPVFEEYTKSMEEFLFKHLVPASADTIHDYLVEFAAKAAGLSITGLVFVLGAAVLLIFSMESALNAIWRVKTRRHGVTAFLNYWAVLTLLPIIAVSALAISVYLVSLPYLKGVTDTIGGFFPFLQFLPFVLSWFGFAALYVTLPNTRVRILDASLGALVAAVLFELAKRGFGLYIDFYPTYQIIYGAVATLPILLVWIYLSWIIILFGAVITYVRQSGHELSES